MPAKRTSKSTTTSNGTDQTSRTEKLEHLAGSIATKAKSALSGIGHAIADHMPGHDTEKTAKKTNGGASKTAVKTSVKSVKTSATKKLAKVANSARKAAKKSPPAKAAKKARAKTAK